MMAFNIDNLKVYGRRLLLPLLAGALLLPIIGCDSKPSEIEDYDPDPVLSAFITNGEPVDTIYVEWVGKFHDEYIISELGITNADVILFPVSTLSGNPPVNNDTLTFHYTGIDGEYAPDDLSYIIEGKVRYRIEAKSPDIDIWAETTVPDTFSYEVYQGDQLVTIDPVTHELQGARGDTLTRLDDDLFYRWSESEGSDGLLLGIHALGERDEIVPLSPEYDPASDPENEALAEMVENWPLFIYMPAPDYQNEVTLSWLYMLWTGPTKIMLDACSEDYYLYIFTNIASQETYSNIQGGLGIFGATAKQYMYITMERVEIEE